MKYWYNIFKSNNSEEYKEFMSILPNYRITGTLKTKKCYIGKCAGNHKMIMRYMK